MGVTTGVITGMPINLALTAGKAVMLSGSYDANAIAYSIMAATGNSTMPANFVFIGAMNADGSFPAAPFDETNPNIMATLMPGDTWRLEGSLQGQHTGEQIHLRDYWACCAASARLFVYPLQIQ